MNNKKNNKGFSLVELIVVVAIMAVLVGVLAPAYLKYVENSRIQKDVSAVGEVVQAIKIAAADEDVAKVIKTGATVTVEDNAVPVTADATDALSKELASAIGTVDFSCSDLDGEGKSVTITVGMDATSGALTIGVTSSDATGELATKLTALK